MGVIDDFVREYERQFDFWEASARTAQGLLEAELNSSGLRAIVTSRAKSVDRLEEKLHKRNRKTPYTSGAQISKDIPDLAGVRVALYFPGQMDEVEQVIRGTFDVKHHSQFPPDHDPARVTSTASRGSLTGEEGGPQVAASQNRFSGYGARHFRVHILESSLSTRQERYSSALVEVQVASVLMHAWSEVEHDLVYKPLDGELSLSEYALLDQLNGLVLAGEIALEQLQKAGDARVATAKTPFRDHFELAEFLRTRLTAQHSDLTEATLGRVDVLFDYLTEQNAATAAAVGPYLDQLEEDFEHRAAAAQLADLMLSGDESRYHAYLRAMSASRHPSKRRRTTLSDLRATSPESFAVGEFVVQWVLLELRLKDLIDPDGPPLPLPAQLRRLADQGLITPEQFAELNLMRNLRNEVLHGKRDGIPPHRLAEAAAWLSDLNADLRRKADGG